MGMIEPMAMEFQYEAGQTRKVLERLTEAVWGYRPHEKSMSTAELASHLVTTHGSWLQSTIETDGISVDGYEPWIAASPAEALEAFDRELPKSLEMLAAVPDDKLMQPWSLSMNGQVIFEMPRIQVLRGMILNHVIHHRGQLTVYMRLNDLPLPALYGPSADEQG